MLRVRQNLGKYKIMRRIAEGGFATVYDAYDSVEGVRVALKVPKEQALEGDGRAELLREVRLTAKLEHPNILMIKNAGMEGDHFVIAHRLGEESLADRITRRMSASTALGIADDVLNAVAFAHQKRVVHRDIKPDNVILLADGRACLADFGIAKVALRTRGMTEEGSGTLGYMAPEQALGHPNFRSDVFSLGLLLWRMFSGELPKWPFARPLPRTERVRRAFGPEMVKVLERSLEVDDRKRFANARAMRDAFRRAKRSALRLGAGKSEVKRGTPTKSRSAKEKSGKDKRSAGWKAARARESRRLINGRCGDHTTCSSCDGPVAEMMLFCPWCAVERTYHDGTTKRPRTCRRCNRGMKPDWHYCASCFGPSVKDASTREYSDKGYVRRCENPRCSRKVALPFSKYCPWCRTKLRPWRTLPHSSKCKRCNWSIFPGFWDYCPWCSKET